MLAINVQRGALALLLIYQRSLSCVKNSPLERFVLVISIVLKIEFFCLIAASKLSWIQLSPINGTKIAAECQFP